MSIDPNAAPTAMQPDGLLSAEMTASELRLHMGEMTAQEVRTARAAIGWANSKAAAHITHLEADVARLAKEREREKGRRDHTVQWYAERLRKIEDVAKRECLWPEIAAIIANGSGTRQLTDGTFVYDPPNYAQQINSAKDRAETAEAQNKAMRDLVEQAFRDGLAYGSNVSNGNEPGIASIAWAGSRARATLSTIKDKP